ncbi:MAG: peptide deformylase [Pseudomonadota bacterium]
MKGKLRQIAQLGHEILRRKAAAVTAIRSREIRSLIDDMLETLRDSNGVGIAAPQIYEPYRIVIVASKPSPRYPTAPEMAPLVMINPSIESVSGERVKDWEGCLSIPGIRALIPRHRQIRVIYTDTHAIEQEIEISDFIARIFQHEFDHLEGVVFLDRVENTRDIVSEKEYFKRIAG